MSLSYSAASVTVSDGTVSAVFTVTRSGTTSDLSGSSSVDYSTEDVTATAGTDYTATSGSLYFAADVTEGTVTVTISSDAYSGTAKKTFLLELGSGGVYGNAVCTIQPTTTASTTQTYLYIPSDDDSVTVPTADSPGDNLKYQALYSDFSTPEDSSIDMPLAYFRLGYASSDLNEYERVILNSDNYHPEWLDTEDDGTPVEFGPMIDFALPRPINRVDNSSSEQEELEEDNAHLDGIFLYSNASYSVTVAEQYSKIIKGDYIKEVAGRGRILWYDVRAEWVYYEGSTEFLNASGSAKINGLVTYYQISNSINYNVSSSMEVSYNLSAKYSVSSDVQFSFANDAKYSVHNGVGLAVSGLEVDGKCDILGNYSANYPGGAFVSTQGMVSQAATEMITISIQTGYSSAWTTALQAAAVLNAQAAEAISAADAVKKFESEGDFYKTASPDNLDDEFSEAFSTYLPDICVGLGLATSILLVAACIAQQIAELVTVGLPKIEMDSTGLVISCGPQTEFAVNATGIYLTAPLIDLAATGNVDIAAGSSMELQASTEILLTSVSNTVSGNLEIVEDLDVLGDAEVVGDVYGSLVQVG